MAAGLAFGFAGFDFDFDLLFDPAGHGPIVSPWRRCAGTAFWLTVIVTDGFFAEPVRWQIVTLPPVVVVVGVVVVVVPVVVLVDVVVVVGTVVVVVLEVLDVVELVLEVVEVLDVVDVDVLEVELVDEVEPVVDVVDSCWDDEGFGPRTPRAAATPSPLRSASAASVAAKRTVRRGRGFTGGSSR